MDLLTVAFQRSSARRSLEVTYAFGTYQRSDFEMSNEFRAKVAEKLKYEYQMEGSSL